MAKVVELYQGTDWFQQLGFFYDEAQTQPYPIVAPYCELRDPTSGALLATFVQGGSGAWMTLDSPGWISLHMDHVTSATIPTGRYPIDVFADVNGVRTVLSERGNVTIQVKARITQDPA